MAPTDLTIEILKGIRDEVKGVREEVNGMRDEVRGVREEVNGIRGQLGETNARLDRLERRQADTEIRLSTQLVAVVDAVRDVRDLLREDRALHDRVDDHERRLAAVERRV